MYLPWWFIALFLVVDAATTYYAYRTGRKNMLRDLQSEIDQSVRDAGYILPREEADGGR